MAAKKKTKKSGSASAAKKPSREYEHVVAMLKKNKKADFASIRDAGAKKGMKIYPIVFGRAQAALGIVKSRKRGEGKAAQKKSGGAITRRGPGRPRKVTGGNAMAGLDSIIDQIKQTERERDRAIQTLQKIRELIDSAI